MAKGVFGVLSESVVKALSEALDIVMPATKYGASLARGKSNTDEKVSMTAIACLLIEKIRQGLAHVIDNAIEISVYNVWAEYVDVHLCIVVRDALAENNLAHRSRELENALEEHAVDDMSRKVVSQDVRDALGSAITSAITSAMIQTMRAAVGNTPNMVSPDAITDVLLRNLHTALIHIINIFAKGSLTPVADAVCAVVTELITEALYDDDRDAESVGTGAKDGDGDVKMGGC